MTHCNTHIRKTDNMWYLGAVYLAERWMDPETDEAGILWKDVLSGETGKWRLWKGRGRRKEGPSWRSGSFIRGGEYVSAWAVQGRSFGRHFGRHSLMMEPVQIPYRYRTDTARHSTDVRCTRRSLIMIISPLSFHYSECSISRDVRCREASRAWIPVRGAGRHR